MFLLNKDLFGEHKYIYDTNMCLDECVNRILSSPHIFGENTLNPERYECALQSKGQIEVVFKGAAFGKARKTEYLISLFENGDQTMILVEFIHELLGFPPMTSIQLIDVFMLQKVHGCRRK